MICAHFSAHLRAHLSAHLSAHLRAYIAALACLFSFPANLHAADSQASQRSGSPEATQTEPLEASGADKLTACNHQDDSGDPGAGDCYRYLLEIEPDDRVRAEALWRLGNIEAANRAFRRAVDMDPDNADLLARWGLLFLTAHQAADAETLFTDALNLDPDQTQAQLGLAELAANRFENRAREIIDTVLDREPDNAEAKLLLARLYLEVGDIESGREMLAQVLETLDNADAQAQKTDAGTSSGLMRVRLDTYALLAAADHAAGEIPSSWTAQALEINPAFGDIYAVPAYYYVITRRYIEAVAMLEQAAEIEPEHWQAHTDLGINLLRLNRFEDARDHLERAYQGDPFNAEVVNTLRLLDSMSDFDTRTFSNLILRTHRSETALLTPYVRQLVDRAELEMAPRYGYRIQRPVVIELYQHHDDFAVRTAGLPGLGILGATFGDVVVMDGPSAKSAETFDWVSATWHEIAHVITLNATNNLVSRWFSEGVSVYEEWSHGPSPTDFVPLHFLEAMKEELLLPVAELDEGFIRPKYSNQIAVSYLQAGLLCTFIAETYEGGLVGMLEAYRNGSTTLEAVELGLGVSPEQLDEEFAGYLDTRFAFVMGNLDAFQTHSREAALALREARWADAQRAAEQAIALYPEYAGPGSPYLLLARATHMTHEEIHEEGEIHGEGQIHGEGAGSDDAAVNEQLADVDASVYAEADALDAMSSYWRHGGRDPVALDILARGYQAAQRSAEAIAVQQALVRLVPLNSGYHATLGEWLSAARRPEDALIEYQAVLALDPHDKATAHYRVAATLHTLNRTEEARRELLYALEIAPRYSPALSLLVEITQ